MKKKILLAALALVLLLTLTGCSSKVVGTWSNHVVSKMTIELNKDKTFTYTDKVGSSTSVYTGTYTVSGKKITLNSEEYSYTSRNYNSGFGMPSNEEYSTKTKSSYKVFEAEYSSYEGEACIVLDGYRFYRVD